MCYNHTGNISTLDGTSLKLEDKFTYLGSSVSSTEKDIDTRLTKAWTAIDRLSIIWKSDLTDKMKRSLFQAAVVSILLYGCTTWTLTKRLEKKLDGNYTRMLRAILNMSWWQHPTRHQLYGHLHPITKTIQVRRTRHAGHCWNSRDELMSDVLLWTPHMAGQKQDDKLEHTFSSYVRIRDVAPMTCQRRWTIGRSEERGSGISVLAARHDDDDEFDINSWIKYIVVNKWNSVGLLDTNGSPYLGPSENFLKRTCHLVDFVVPASHWMNRKESEKIDKYMDLSREEKRRRTYEWRYTKYKWWPLNGSQSLRLKTRGIRNQCKNRDQLDHSIVIG